MEKSKKQTDKPPKTSAMATSSGNSTTNTLLAKQAEGGNTPISEKSIDTKKSKGNKPGNKASIPAKENADANNVEEKTGTAMTNETIIEVNTTSASEIEEITHPDSPTVKEIQELETKDWLPAEKYIKTK